MSTRKLQFVAIFMWLLPLSFFAYQFILRLFPSLIMQQIMQQFSIDATAFGVLASVYYYSYAGMQIPIAIALDRYGPKYVVFSCAVICGIATLIFSITDNWYLVLLSRFLIGAGSAVGFLGTSKVISEWFTKEQYTKMIGLSFTIGLMGAIYGGKPVSLLIENFGWKQVALILSFVALAIGCLAYLFLREPKSSHIGNMQEHIKFEDFKQLVRSPVMWVLAIANLLMVGSLEGFADVWGVNYLMTAYHISKSEAAELTSFIFVGMLFGGPLLALLSQKLGDYTVICFCGFGMAVALGKLVFFASIFNWYGLAILFTLIGVMCCYQVIMFSVGSSLVSHRLLGVTVAFLNCMNMLGGSFFHTLIGYAMDKFWAGEMNNGVREYSLESYNHALLLIPICACVGAVMVYMVSVASLRVSSRSSTG